MSEGVIKRESPPTRELLVQARHTLGELIVLLLEGTEVISVSMGAQPSRSNHRQSHQLCTDRVLIDGEPWAWNDVNPLLTVDLQTKILRHFVGVDTEANPLLKLGDLGSDVASMNVDPIVRQKRRKKAKANHKPKQLVDWSRNADPEFVTHNDVRQLIERKGLVGPLLERAPTKVWMGDHMNLSCFGLDLHWVDSKQISKAEAMLMFMRAGDNWATAEAKLDRCPLVKPAEFLSPPVQWSVDKIERDLPERFVHTERC